MKPDDFMKRGFLLPEGCKDLTDVYKQMLQQAGDLPHPAPAFTDMVRRLIEEYSRRLADPNLTTSQRTTIESNLKELRKHLGNGGLK